jgi:hypothetical protein
MGCLKNLVITAVGDMGPGKSNEQLKRWVEANSGRWQPRFTKGVTHLICSKDAYKKNDSAGTSSQIPPYDGQDPLIGMQSSKQSTTAYSSSIMTGLKIRFRNAVSWPSESTPGSFSESSDATKKK